MNGDFLSLLGKQSGSGFPAASASASNLGPIRNALPPELTVHGTTVFAFHCKEGVIIAGDHRATAGNIIFSDTTEKILELDSHSLMAIAGVPATAFEMARTLQTTFEFYR